MDLVLPESRYLSFELDDHYDGKTELVEVVSKKHLRSLGEIKWYGPWRQYAFFPYNETVWNPGCMDDIKACIDVLKERRESGKREEERAKTRRYAELWDRRGDESEPTH